MAFYFVQFLTGLASAASLFLIASGLSIIFGVTRIVNFAHGAFYMLGAYFAYTLQDGIGFWAAILVSPMLVGLVGVVVERYFLRRVHHHGHAHELLLTFGLSFIIAELIKLFFGNFPVNYRVPQALDVSAFSLGGAQYPAYRLLMGGVANMAPQDYRVIIAQVPFVDVVTTMLDESIPLTTNEFDEWGNPKDKAAYDYMLSYSPYDNVKAQAYPSIYVRTGLWDSQVQYFEPAKWVAKLRATRTDDNLILLDTDMAAGHGGKSGRFDRLHDVARTMTFLLLVHDRPDRRPHPGR